MKKLEHLSEIYKFYDTFVIDLWGVMHNGISLNYKAIEAASNLLKDSKKIVFLSNAPRPSEKVREFLKKLKMEEKYLKNIITSGEAAMHAINEIHGLLPKFIKQKTSFIDKKSELNHELSLFDSQSLHKLSDDLEKSQFNTTDIESKVSEITKQIDSSKNLIHDIISKLELNLRQASSIAYKISYSENDLQN